MTFQIKPCKAIPNNYSFYTALDPTIQEIRLLFILPSKNKSTITTVGLFHVSLLSNPFPFYEAVSYCWGDLSDTKQITVEYFFPYSEKDSQDSELWYGGIKNVFNFKISTSLHRALCNLQHPDTERLLWVDMICINQGDQAEKSQQVGFMRQVYSKAQNVLVCLDEVKSIIEHKKHSEALKALHDLGVFGDYLMAEIKKIANPGATPSITDSTEKPDPTSFVQRYLDFVREREPTAHHAKREAVLDTMKNLSSLFNLSWFRRMWVLQEVGVSKMSIVLHGNQNASWGCLMRGNTMARLMAIRDIFGDDRAPGSSIWGSNLPQIWVKIADQEPESREFLPLIELIFRTRDFGSSDPRDKLFALLGLAHETTGMNILPVQIRPDYSKSISQVFGEYTRWIIVQQKSLDILSAVTRPFGRQVINEDGSKNPSWVPNYASHIPDAGATLGYPTLYQAASATETRLEDCSEPESLILQGYLIDTVKGVMCGDFFSGREGYLLVDDDNKYGEYYPALPLIWFGCVNDLQNHSYGNGRANAIFRTLLCCIIYGNSLDDNVDTTLFRAPYLKANLWKVFASQWKHAHEAIMGDLPVSEELDQVFSAAADGDEKSFLEAALSSCVNRRFFWTQEQHIGLCPRTAQIGDLIVIFHGGSVLYILREKPDKPKFRLGKASQYEFIGECYVDGYMNGKTFEKLRQLNVSARLFDLR